MLQYQEPTNPIVNAAGISYEYNSSSGDVPVYTGSSLYGADDYKRVGNWFTDWFDPGAQATYDKRYTMAREDTAYQRKVQDLIKAGLNPILAASGSGSESSFGGGSNQMSGLIQGAGKLSPIVAELILKGKELEKKLDLLDKDIDVKEQDVANRKEDLQIKKKQEDLIQSHSDLLKSQGFLTDRMSEKAIYDNRDRYKDKFLKGASNYLDFLKGYDNMHFYKYDFRGSDGYWHSTTY